MAPSKSSSWSRTRKAKRAYAWSHETNGGKRRFYAVLGLAPVVDAVTAVRASTVAG